MRIDKNKLELARARKKYKCKRYYSSGNSKTYVLQDAKRRKYFAEHSWKISEDFRCRRFRDCSGGERWIIKNSMTH